MQRLLGRREAILAVLVAALFGAVTLRAPVFSSAGNLSSLLDDGAILTIMALAQMLALITRGVDLSVGASMALTGMLTALLSRASPELPAWLALLLGSGVGLSLGAVNGLCIAGLGLPPIVVTLGTMSVYRGLVFVVSGGAWVNAHELGRDFSGLSPSASVWPDAPRVGRVAGGGRDVPAALAPASGQGAVRPGG